MDKSSSYRIVVFSDRRYLGASKNQECGGLSICLPLGDDRAISVSVSWATVITHRKLKHKLAVGE